MDDLLTELGWTKRDLAKRLNLHRNTISRWKKPPEAVLAYLKLRVGLKRLLDD
jgi:transposase